jgi:hypothetical protein
MTLIYLLYLSSLPPNAYTNAEKVTTIPPNKSNLNCETPIAPTLNSHLLSVNTLTLLDDSRSIVCSREGGVRSSSSLSVVTTEAEGDVLCYGLFSVVTTTS